MGFNIWRSTSSWELDNSGINYKLVSRFNKFQNVPELSKMYSNVADVITNTDIMKYQKDFVPKLEGDKPINIIAPRSDDIARYIGVQNEKGEWNEGSIIWRMEHRDEDIVRNNMLACTTDARKAGLDYRLINEFADDYRDSKTNKLISNVINEYNIWNNVKGTQLIFCDLSTPKTHSQKVSLGEEIIIDNTDDKFVNINEALESDGEEKTESFDEILAKNAKFDVYSDILKKLVNNGIPQNEIRFIHDAKTDLQKAQLFADVNSGKVRILIGSTQKMGAGTNVQQRVVALHHLDCPWRPSDLEQRRGRVIRQGNKFFNDNPQEFRIKEFRYATEKTYDARMWQVIENKALSIEQFRKAGVETRILDDITMSSADAAEMKAEATGNPLILMQVQISSNLREEEIFYSNYKRQIYNNENNLNHCIASLKDAQEKLSNYNTIKQTIEKIYLKILLVSIIHLIKIMQNLNCIILIY